MHFGVCDGQDGLNTYFMGGLVNYKESGVSYKFDGQTLKWTCLPEMNFRRYKPGSFITREKTYLYVF